MPIQAFIDDSGGVGQTGHFVLAGYIGHVEDWAAFSDEWRAICERGPKTMPFKMRDAVHFAGAFAGWPVEARDQRVRELAETIVRYPFTTFHCITDLEGFSKTIPEAVQKRMAQPYVFAFQMTIMGVAYELLERGQTERFEIIFDEQVIFGPRALKWYELIKALADDDVGAIMPLQPMFQSDDAVMPLQAADLLAWMFRRDVDDEPHSFGWLGRLFNAMHLSDHSQFVDEERMRFQVTMSMDPAFADDAVSKILEAQERESRP